MLSLWERLNRLPVDAQDLILGQCSEVSESDLEHQYDDMLNECSETVMIGSLAYDPATVLKAVDPIAYSCGFSDYTGTNDSLIEFKGCYYDTDELEKELEDYLENQVNTDE